MVIEEPSVNAAASNGAEWLVVEMLLDFKHKVDDALSGPGYWLDRSRPSAAAIILHKTS
jgi:hypothetical protein